MYKIKNLLISVALAIATCASAATWNQNYGMGNPSDNWAQSGTGAFIPVIANIHSNAVYFVSSAKASGQPVWENIWLNSDFAAATLKFYKAAQAYTITNTGIAGTNVICLNETNNLAANGIYVIRNVSSDNYQMVLGTNSFAYALVTYTSITNGYSSGDILYRMVETQSLTPLSMTTITNQTILPFSETIPLAIGGAPKRFYGDIGMPSMLVLTVTAAGKLYPDISYQIRQRR